MLQFVLIPIDSGAYRVSDIGIGEFAQNPSMREHLGEYRAVPHAAGSNRHIQCPPVAQKTAIVDTGAFGAEEACGFVLLVLGGFRAFTHHEMAAVQPEFPVGSEQPSALPAVAFPEKRHGMEPGRAGNCCPGTLGLLLAQATTREVDEVAAIGRKVGPAFINPAAKPLAEFEFIGRAVPANRTYRVSRTPAEHQT